MTTPNENTIVFVIRTDEYAGNFEREMTAYITGQVGDCSVGEKIANREREEIVHADWFEEQIKQVPDEHGCARPTAAWQIPEDVPSNKWHTNGYSGVAIFLEERPPVEVLEEMKARAHAFTKTHDGMGRPRDIKILGFWLVDYRVEITQIKEAV